MSARLGPVREDSARPFDREEIVESDGRRRWWPWVAGLLVVAVVLSLVLRDDEPATRPGGRGPGGPTAVRAAEASLGTVAVWGRYPGELVGEAVDLAPRASGRLEAVTVRPGERVGAGQVVARLDPVLVAREAEEAGGQRASAAASRDRAAAALVEARADLARAEELWADALISEQEMDRARARAATAEAELAAAEAQVRQMSARAERLEQQVADTALRAPFAATVADRFLDPGAMVTAGTPILRLVEEGTLLVQFRVPERDLGRVAPGVAIEVTTQATGDRVFAGEVRRVAGEVSRQDRTALVEASLADPGAVLRPGMYAEVRARLETLDGALTVPGSALVERVGPTGESTTGIFTVAGDPPAAAWRPARVLAREGERTAIESDVAPGEPVLVLGHDELSDGSPVKIVEGPGADPAIPDEEEGAR